MLTPHPYVLGGLPIEGWDTLKIRHWQRCLAAAYSPLLNENACMLCRAKHAYVWGSQEQCMLAEGAFGQD